MTSTGPFQTVVWLYEMLNDNCGVWTSLEFKSTRKFD